jgi:hypothetical protein
VATYIIKRLLHLVVVLINRETKSSLEKVPSPIPPGAIRETVDTDIVVAGAGLFEQAAAASAMHDSMHFVGRISRFLVGQLASMPPAPSKTNC